jgi:hypothetical protein
MIMAMTDRHQPIVNNNITSKLTETYILSVFNQHIINYFYFLVFILSTST